FGEWMSGLRPHGWMVAGSLKDNVATEKVQEVTGPARGFRAIGIRSRTRRKLTSLVRRRNFVDERWFAAAVAAVAVCSARSWITVAASTLAPCAWERSKQRTSRRRDDRGRI